MGSQSALPGLEARDLGSSRLGSGLLSLPGASGGSQGGDIVRRSESGTEPGTPVPRDVRWAAVSEAEKWNKIPF